MGQDGKRRVRARKVDSNLTSIVDALRKLGLKVHVTNGDWDLTAQFGGVTMLCEVRPEGKPKVPRKGNQERVHETLMIYWLQTVEDCLELNKTLRKWQQAVSGLNAIPDAPEIVEG